MLDDRNLPPGVTESNENINPSDRPVLPGDAVENWAILPEGLRAGMRLYLNYGIKPGGFLTACLENNFIEALGRADYINAQCLPEIARFIYNEIPGTAWGSPTKVAVWQERMKNVR